MQISLYIIVVVVLMIVGIVFILTVTVRLIPTKKDVASLPKMK